MLEIVNLTHGEILNRHHGKVNGNALTVPVTGLCRSGDFVTINGVAADCCGECFRGEVELKETFSTIVVEAEGNRGNATRSIKVVRDMSECKRVDFCIDDNVYFLADIAKERPRSLFDHFYLKGLRDIHQKYGLRVTLNLFYRDVTNNFTLADFPESYRDEWRANSDWLTLAFHARAEFPDRIYQNAELDEFFADYDQVENEIRRFAGEETLIAPPNIHWSMVKPDSFVGMKERGVRFMGGMFINGQTRIGEKMSAQPCCDVGFFENEENSLFLTKRHFWHDFRWNMTLGHEMLVLNLEPLPILEEKLSRLIAEPDTMVMYMLTHEQYTFPRYKQYLPDHFARMELMARMLTEAGYRFVFFNQDGFLGAPQN